MRRTALRRRKRERTKPYEGPIRCPGHLQWVRGLECCGKGKNGHICWGRAEAHHVKGFGEGAMGRKPGDDKAVPVCSGLHYYIHSDGEAATGKRYGINFEAVAEQCWREDEYHRGRYEQKQRESA